MVESDSNRTQLEQICIQAFKAQEDHPSTYQNQDLEQQKEQPSASRDVCPMHQNEVILRIECITERQMKVMTGPFWNAAMHSLKTLILAILPSAWLASHAHQQAMGMRIKHYALQWAGASTTCAHLQSYTAQVG